MLFFAIIFLIISLLFVFAVQGRRIKGIMDPFYGWSYAHRGLYGDGIPENSLKAFEAAKHAGYGVELDVHLLKDGELAVLHDSKLQRMTGQPGLIEDLNSDDLHRYYLNGTDQTIPLFSDVLALYDGAAPLIVELKSSGKDIAQLCQNTCKLLDNYHGVYCLESFDPRCVRWLKDNRPDLIRGQLSENYFASETAVIPGYLKFLLTHMLLNFLTKPNFVAYRYKDRKTLSNFVARKIWRLPSISWTVQSKQEYDIAVAEGNIPIFENFRP